MIVFQKVQPDCPCTVSPKRQFRHTTPTGDDAGAQNIRYWSLSKQYQPIRGRTNALIGKSLDCEKAQIRLSVDRAMDIVEAIELAPGAVSRCAAAVTGMRILGRLKSNLSGIFQLLNSSKPKSYHKLSKNFTAAFVDAESV
jgi:hypothetical protein